MQTHSRTNPALAAVIARARAAVTGTPAPSAPQFLDAQTPAQTARPGTDSPAPARVLPIYPPAAQVAADQDMPRGEARLWAILHRLAVDVARFRAYGALPSAVCFHLPACALARFLGYSERHLYRLADGLTARGLLAGGGHAQNVGGRSLWDGSLWKVATTPGHVPSVTGEEWRHNWRPGFSADYTGKTGAAAEMSGLQTAKADAEMLYTALKTRAAVPDAQKAPAVSSPDISVNADLYAIAADLPDIVTAHPTKRHALVGALASRIAVTLSEPNRRRQWAGTLYRVLAAENEGRPAASAFALQLVRLAADLREGAPWKAPGAVLASRLA